jgi:hypothetical protein
MRTDFSTGSIQSNKKVWTFKSENLYLSESTNIQTEVNQQPIAFHLTVNCNTKEHKRK